MGCVWADAMDERGWSAAVRTTRSRFGHRRSRRDRVQGLSFRAWLGRRVAARRQEVVDSVATVPLSRRVASLPWTGSISPAYTHWRTDVTISGDEN